MKSRVWYVTTAIVLAVLGLVLLQACKRTEVEETVLLYQPPDNTQSGLTVTFVWQLSDTYADYTYTARVMTDKGADPFDGDHEDAFFAGSATELTRTLDRGRYLGVSFQWGVLVERSDGKKIESTIRTLHITGQ